MLARLARELPVGDFLYEPKWDGFRCLAACHDGDIDLRSRNDRPLARYFPEVAGVLQNVLPPGTTIDGELLVTVGGVFDFSALLARLHPARSRVARLAETTPAILVAFDVVESGGVDVTGQPFAARRALLESLLAGADRGTVTVTELTDDLAVASEWLRRSPWPGGDGVVAKARDLPYQPGKRAMIKGKHERTADCVVAGLRVYADGEARPGVASLLLGLYDEGGTLRHVGVAASFRTAQREAMLRELVPLRVPLARHPWREGFALEGGPTGRLPGAAGRWSPELSLDWLPLAPVRVGEVTYDQVDHLRFRHPARFKRWRPDRDPTTCSLAQLGAAA